jgi:hypothetical protein
MQTGAFQYSEQWAQEWIAHEAEYAGEETPGSASSCLVGTVSLAAERGCIRYSSTLLVRAAASGAAMMAFIEKLARRQGALLMRTVSIPPVARFRIPIQLAVGDDRPESA